MSAIDNASTPNPILESLKTEIKKLVWDAYEDVKDQSINVRLSVFKIPLNFSIKISQLREVLVLIAGEEPS